jgi:hypothetical protein
MPRARIRVFKFTDDDWYGNHKLTEAYPIYNNRTRLVTVSLLTLVSNPNQTYTRVCVWGNDDYGLEKDFDNRPEAEAMFMLVISQDAVNQKWLKSKGFINA